MQNALFEQRLENLKTVIDSNNQALLITNEKNIGYFCGFFHSEGYLLVTENETVLFVDFRYYEAALKKSSCCKVVCFTKLFKDLISEVKNNSVVKVLFEASNITVEKYSRFKKAFSENGIDCICNSILDDKIDNIRCIKDKSEIAKIAKAQEITEKSYLEVLNYLKPGVSERRVALELEHLIKLNGGEGVSFDLITITGKKTSLPHGVPSDDIVSEGDFFTFDIGSIFEGYHSDTTRTVAVKSASEEMRKVYDTVLKAQLAVLDGVKSGAKCSDVDKIARDIILENGYGKYFGHATGHGVGLDIHESPVVSPRSETMLKKGMIITDEPGIYLPGKFGVRIEDMLCVTDTGYKNFVSLPKELIIV